MQAGEVRGLSVFQVAKATYTMSPGEHKRDYRNRLSCAMKEAKGSVPKSSLEKALPKAAGVYAPVGIRRKPSLPQALRAPGYGISEGEVFTRLA